MIATYYLGRLSGRSPHSNVERLISLEAQKMTLTEFQVNATRCGNALAAEGRQIQRISMGLFRKEKNGAIAK